MGEGGHPVQEVQTLLCLLDQWRDVHRPHESVCDLHPQELAVLLMRSGTWLGWFLLKSTMISLPAHQLLHLLSVFRVAVVPDEAHHCCVVCKLHSVIGGSPGDAIVCHEGKQQRAQDTALRGVCAEADDTGGAQSDPHWRWSFIEKVW